MKKFLVMGTILLSSVLLLAGCSLSDWKVKSGLQVITNDVPSSLFLDGKYLDKTPYINKEIQPGDYTLEIRPDDSKLVPYQTKVSLKKGLLTVVTWKPGDRPETSGGVTYEMEQLTNSKQSELSIVTIPDGAIVHVDGQAKGFAPVLVENVSGGEHEYEITLPSYETQKNTINALVGYRMDVTVTLAKQEAALSDGANASAGASVVVTPIPMPGSSPIPVASVLPSISPAPTLTPIVSPVPSPSSLPAPKVIIKHTGLTINGQEVLRVRQAANASATQIGLAPTGSEYVYLKVTSDSWYKISFNGQEGWVSAQYAQLVE